MATFYQSPRFIPLNVFPNQESCTIFYHYPPRKGFNFAICSAKKSRVRRKVKSDEELRSDIKDFVLAVGLPDRHVPSMKELSYHGRNDLAHIVRRRGYKFIRELLSNSIEDEGLDVERGLVEGKDSVADGLDISEEGQAEKVEDVIEDCSSSTEIPTRDHSSSTSINAECFSSIDSSMARDSLIDAAISEIESENIESSSSMHLLDVGEQDDRVQTEVKDISLPGPSDDVELLEREVSSISEYKSLLSEGLIMSSSHGSLDGTSASDSNVQISLPVKTLANSSSEENALKASKNQDDRVTSMAEENSSKIEVSNLECLAHDGKTVVGLNPGDQSGMPVDPAINSTLEDKVAKFIQSGELDAIDNNVYGILDKSAEESKGFNVADNETKTYRKDNEPAHNGSNAPLFSNENTSISENHSHLMMVNHPVRNEDLTAGVLASSDRDKDLEIETSKRENEVEINRLKIMLHIKELELSHLKEQIEKEKSALSELQDKAQMEIRKAQKLISEKDAEVLAAEGSLSGLVEVEIRYSGSGENVEVTGSFNGWQHRIKMDPHPSLSIIHPAGSRNSTLWSTTLWLYPGVYEIKFIVDGHWTSDPQGEMITTRSGICNNVLRVVGRT